MCQTLIINNKQIHTKDKLAAEFGVLVLPMDDGADEAPDDTCLCGIDILKACEDAGYVAFCPAYENGDSLEYRAVPIEAAWQAFKNK